MSRKSFDFLTYLFKKYDVNNDGCLSQNELENLFSVCSISSPWNKDVHNTVETDLNYQITYQGFLSQFV